MVFSQSIKPMREDRIRCILHLLTAAILGSLAGALCAKFRLFHCSDLLFRSGVFLKKSSFLPSALLSLLFPLFLIFAFAAERRWLFFLLFFCKGAIVSFLLCFSSGCGLPISLFTKALVFRTAIPLTLHYFTASCLMTAQNGFSDPTCRWLIPMNIAAAVLITALELLL